MRLTAIKLAGFKSFVDPTTFRAPTNLTGIVGPNGCGKSNIIDAVRWVMGEGSARVLRGELMSDVIFSGSSSRKPVGTATVELLFDNADGKIGGEFADYAEISVKRQVSRDGLSTYFLNGTRCRRKDVRDLFLGTGVGTEGYSVIEQGMISQVVEARPEQIRGYLEEAAGISRYKERRRETESRISHTRDNLDRLADVREEVDNHLSRLQRQARAAERYQVLKEQQRELETRLLALQWQQEMTRAHEGKEQLARQETALAEKVAEQRAAESRMEKLHQQQADANESMSTVQGELYEVASEIARLEQTIAHQRELLARQRQEYDETSGALQDLEQHMLLDKAQVSDLAARLARLEPELETALAAEGELDAKLTAAEAAVQDWQERLEAHHGEFGELNRQADGLRTVVEVTDQRMATAAKRLQALGEEAKTNGEELAVDGADLESQARQAAAAEDAGLAALREARETLANAGESLREASAREHQMRGELLDLEGRLQALEALQMAGQEQPLGLAWLDEHGVTDSPLLAAELQVEPGWETALETVLAPWLKARVITALGDRAAHIDQLQDAHLALLSASRGTVRARSGSLAEKVQGPDAVIAMLNHVRVVDTLEDALESLDLAGGEQSAITRAGEWLGPGWTRVARGASAEAGILAREQDMGILRKQIGSLREEWQALCAGNARQRDALPELERKTTELQAQVHEQHRIRTQLESRLAAARERHDELSRRRERNDVEAAGLRQQIKADEQAVRKARAELDVLLERMAGAEQLRAALDQERNQLLQARDSGRKQASEQRARRHELALETGSARASLDSLNQALARMNNQVGQLQQRYVALSESLAKAKDPEQESRTEMDALLNKRVGVEVRLADARRQVQDFEAQYREQDGLRQAAVQQAEGLRSTLERARLQQQEVELGARAIQRQVQALGAEVETLAGQLPDDADAQQWSDEIERLGVRITRLEPVNLAAISEYEEEAKRKEYLDAQHADLVEALSTLEAAIAKIDRKTRTRFKDTFEMVNKGMQELFPRLFGGGHGYLEMTGEDLLSTGVSIMARPPGKRVSSIHLLSGGEKALTAVAFVFSIFRLNPAPFCLLDEVDAPLDDANVVRFSELVREMSESVQFIIVTHNKVTMEMAHQLSGVTMQEPGVSRLVQVDIDEATRLAAS